MQIRKYNYLLLTFLLFVTHMLCVAQENRPKVGLALSGGGAKGIAHIGVLQVLEEEGIKPDFITGVSMGSIVSGLYAIGYSPDSLATLFRAQDWDYILSDNISENTVAFDEKQFYRNSLFDFTVDAKGISGFDGFILGQHISEMLSYYTWPAYGTTSFDDYDIPLRIMAFDGVSCQPITIDSGNLGQTIRASMAIPTVFSPVEKDSMLLVDGGVYRNFPVTEVIDMGAEVVIGSDVGDGISTREEVEPIFGMLFQLSTFTSALNNDEQGAQTDLLFDFDFRSLGYTSADFNQVDTLIKIGYNLADQQRDEIRKLADSLGIRQEIKRTALKSQAITINNIEIYGNKVISDEQILSIMNLRIGDNIHQQEIDEKIKRLYSRFLFDLVKYNFKKTDDGITLVLECTEKPKNLFNVSFRFDNYFRFGVNTSFVTRNLGFDQSRFSVELFLSEFFRVKTNYLVNLDKANHWNIMAGYWVSKDEVPINLPQESYQYYKSLANELDVHVNFKPNDQNQNISLGVTYKSTSFRPTLPANTEYRKALFNDIEFNASYAINSLNHYYFPKNGIEFMFQTNYVPSTWAYYDFKSSENPSTKDQYQNYLSFILRSRYFFEHSARISTTLRVNGSLSTENSGSASSLIFIGGTEQLTRKSLPFYGFNQLSFTSKQALGGGVGLIINPTPEIQLGLNSDYYTISLLDETISKNSYTHNLGVGIEVGYKSAVIPPIKLGLFNGYTFGENAQNTFSFSFAFGFVNL